MKIYKKRIAFLISDQHFVPHGGIGQFAKGFTEMCSRLNWKVDILLDKKPDDNFKSLFVSLGANIIYPKEPLKYTEHTATFAFTDSINFEKIINFRKSLMQAFETNVYDMIVCNTQEAMSAAYALAVNKYIPVVFYTHLHSMIFREAQNFVDVFLESYHNFYNKHMELPDIIIGTQTQKNINELTKFGAKNCHLLRMPIPERKLLEPYYGQRKGVLFIGRWEKGKNFNAYLKVIRETRLPAKVMTNSSGAKKFKKAFEEMEFTDYEIIHGVTGDEKVNFIKSSKVFFMPSLRESYSFAFVECLGHMPCVVLDNQDWSNNFDSKYFWTTNLDCAGQVIQNRYEDTNDYYATGALDYIKQLDEEVSIGWFDFLNGFEGKKSNNKNAKILEYDTVKYRDFIVDLNRKMLAREDFESVLSNKYKYRTVVYTDEDTYMSMDENFTVSEKASETLFEGL